MISEEEVKHIAYLARISLSLEELRKFQKDLSLIIDYFNILQRIDTKGVDSKFSPSRQKNISRKDQVQRIDENRVEEMIKLFPEKEGRYLKVKKIL